MRASFGQHLDNLTEKIIGAAFSVSNGLGHGFLEKVYQNALAEEFTVIGLAASTEKSYSILYRGKAVGRYEADLVVENTVIVELKAVERLAPMHVAQVINYLKASRLPIGLLLNFGTPKLEVRRVLGQSVKIR